MSPARENTLTALCADDPAAASELLRQIAEEVESSQLSVNMKALFASVVNEVTTNRPIKTKRFEPGFLPAYIQPMQIKKILGVIGRTKALELEASDPDFPKRIHLWNGKATAWRTCELIDYIERAAQQVGGGGE